MISWAELGRRWDGDVRAKQRLLPAVWSTTFHRLFSEDASEAGPQESLLHEAARPETPGRAVAMAVRAFDDNQVGATPLRLVGNNVVYSRYRLDKAGKAAMRRLACRVEGSTNEEAAVRQFTQCRDLYGKPRERMNPDGDDSRPAPAASAPDYEPELRTPRLLSRDPSHYLTYLDVSFDGRMSTCSFELALPVPKNTIVDRIDPRTWQEADSVHFLETRVLEHSEKGELGPPGTVSWKGKYLERFALPWNTQMLSYFSVELLADVSIEQSGARMDYSLLREEKRQIVRDYGFVSVRTRPRYPGWTIVTAEKNTAYSSPLLNALNPAVLGTWIQDQVRTFWRPLEDSAGSAAGRQDIDEDDE